MRAIVLSATFIVAASAVSAQGALSAAKKVAQNAAAATNAHIEAEQHPEAQQKDAAKKAAPAAASQAKTAQSKSAPATGLAKAGEKTVAAPATRDTAAPPPSIFREVFEYAQDGRRDPFNSLLLTSELRPTMSDLRLTGILFDPANRRSGATLRDVSSNAQYKVSVGSTLGRMRVSLIRNKTVVFTIEEFGTTRQDSLVLGDSTKVRKP